MSESLAGIWDDEVIRANSKEAFKGKDSRFRNNENIQKVAAVDIGTNSTHLVIASVDPSLNTFSIDLAEKSSTRLGNRDLETGCLTNSAKDRVIHTLKRFKDIAISHKVNEIRLAATSAVRESPNGQDFLNQIKAELGLEVELISGSEEARLIYLGVLSGMNFKNRPHLILDIGGGSTELILADENDARALTSSRLGAVSLKRDFIRNEPIEVERLNFLKTFIQGSLEPAVNKVLTRIRKGEKAVFVATSGTALAIGALLASSDDNDFLLGMHGYRFPKENLDKLIEKLLGMTPEQRKKLSSLNERRSEIIVPGALVMQVAMNMLQVEEVVLSERALREGLVVDWMFRKGLLRDRYSLQGSIRERTVMHQVERFSVNKNRAERVAAYALDIYDNTKGLLHNDNGFGRSLLWAAAMLHSCGQHINIAAYHKHSWYLIRHCELLGYSHSEHLIVAAIARYQRKSLPKKKHEAWQALQDKEYKKIALEMALVLRMAVALDCRPVQVISKMKFFRKSSELNIDLIPLANVENVELEKWSLSNCIPMVKELTGTNLKVSSNT